MHLLRCLVFVEVQTHSNHLADDLSQSNPFSFYRTCQQPTASHSHLSPAAQPSSKPPGRLGVGAMASSFQRYFQQGLAPSTLRTYNAAMKLLYAFCTKFNVVSPFPVSEHLMCCFAAFLADEGLALQAGKGYLAAVRSMQFSLGLPDLRDQSSLPMLKRVQAGIQRARALSGSSSRTQQPIGSAGAHWGTVGVIKSPS